MRKKTQISQNKKYENKVNDIANSITNIPKPGNLSCIT